MPHADPRSRTRALQGIGLYLCAIALFAAMDASTKMLVGALPVVQVMWARFLFHLMPVAIILSIVHRRLPWGARAPGRQVLRSFLLAGCNSTFALALIYIPLAEATAINFVTPVITVALAALWLRERVGPRRWAGVAVGFAGMLVILQPGQGAMHPAALAVIACAVLFAMYQVVTRTLAGTDPPHVTIFHTGLWATLATSVLVPFVWVAPDARSWAGLVLLGLLGGAGHFLLVLAYDRAPASLLAPLGYVQLIWATLFGLAIFDETPGLATVAGAAVIAAGGLMVLWGESGGRRPVLARS